LIVVDNSKGERIDAGFTDYSFEKGCQWQSGRKTKSFTCSRNAVGRIGQPKVPSNSVSFAGTILCCSSLQSSGIRNSNKQILKRREKEVTTKLWNEAKALCDFSETRFVRGTGIKL
jgi:hypothetical protein